MMYRLVILLMLGWMGCSVTVASKQPHHRHHHHYAFVCPTKIRRGGSLDTAAASEASIEDSILSSTTNNSLVSSNTTTAISSETDSSNVAIIANTTPTTTTTTTTTIVNKSSLEIEILVNTSQDDEDSTEAEASSEAVAREHAMALRLQGKELHDRGEFEDAADVFLRASHLLLEFIQPTDSDHSSSNNNNNNDQPSSYSEVAEEYATCRLHEALCRLKQEDYELCIEACSDVLNEPYSPSSSSSQLEEGKEKENDSVGGGENLPGRTTTLALGSISGAARARAYHRRAKAKLGLGDREGALLDARSAAFLGDRKAVALYGRLLRQDSSYTSSNSMDASIGASHHPFWLSQSDGDSNSDSISASSSMTSALFESLLGGKTAPSSNPMGGLLNDFMSMSSVMNGSNNNNNKNGNSAGSLAQSVLNSLSKRLDDASTQDLICNYLQSTNANQLRQLASLAGFEVSQEQATQVVNFCHKVTPKGISRTIGTTRKVVYGVSLVRKSMKVLRKYNSVLILLAILAWIKSAILRPIPVNKKLAKEIVNAALRKGGGRV